MADGSRRPGHGVRKAFLLAAVESSTDECIVPPGVNPRRAWSVTIDGRTMESHRWLCTLVYGEAPPDRPCACHSCDNPPCVNPRHLRWDTQYENIQDRERRGRGFDRTGLRSPRHALSDDQVREIKRLIAAGVMQKEIAERFGVGKSTITGIKQGKLYRIPD